MNILFPALGPVETAWRWLLSRGAAAAPPAPRVVARPAAVAPDPAQVRHARAAVGQVRRAVLRLLAADDFGLPLVAEDARRLDARVAALGLEPPRLDVRAIARAGRAGERLPAATGRPWRRIPARAARRRLDTQRDVLLRLRLVEARLELMLRAAAPARRAPARPPAPPPAPERGTP